MKQRKVLKNENFQSGKKRVLSLFLALCLCVSLPAFFTIPGGQAKAAAPEKWDGTIDVSWYNTTDTEFTIETPAQLAGLSFITSPKSGTSEDYTAWEKAREEKTDGESMASGIKVDNFTGKVIKLGSDLDMNGSADQLNKPVADLNNTDKNSGGQGSSNGTYEGVAFRGTFDGQGHVISNLYLDGRETSPGNYGGYQGLFAAVSKGAKIENLGLTGTIYGRVIGGVAAVSTYLDDCTEEKDTQAEAAIENYPLIQNCWTDIKTTGNGSGSRPTGGIFGGEGEYRDNCHIINCYAKGTSHNGSSAGGVAGFVNGTIAGCYASGKIQTGANNQSTSDQTGAIVSTLYKPGSEKPDNDNFDINLANGYYGTNAALTGVDYNGNAYRYLDGVTGDTPAAVKDGLITASALKGTAFYQYLHHASMTQAGSDEAYVQDTGNVNDGYPLLYWQTGSVTAAKDLSSAVIAPIADQEYNGQRLEPELSVTLDGTQLYRGTDYLAKYENNVAAGENTATVTLYGVGRYFGKTATAAFSIKRADLSKVQVRPVPAQWHYDRAVEPVLDVWNADGSARLVRGTDFDVVYEQNEQAGTAVARLIPVVDAQSGELLQSREKEITFSISEASHTLKGSGTKEDPYQLSSREDLQFLSHEVLLGDNTFGAGAYFCLTDDIDCTAGAGEALNQPIGFAGKQDAWYTGAEGSESKSVTAAWYGTLDGAGHTIRLAMSDENAGGISNALGLFGLIGSTDTQGVVAEIKNLTLTGEVSSQDQAVSGNTIDSAGQSTHDAAALSGSVQNCDLTLDNINLGVSVSSKAAAAGGIVRLSGQAALTRVSNTGTVEAGSGVAAGLVGEITTGGEVLFSQCSNEGAVTAMSGNAGGLAAVSAKGGTGDLLLFDVCYNSGAVTASGSAGGMIAAFGGSNTNAQCRVSQSYNTGAIKNTKSATSNGAGGLVGTFRMPGADAGSLIIDGYNAGTVTAQGSNSSSGSKAGAMLGFTQLYKDRTPDAVIRGLYKSGTRPVTSFSGSSYKDAVDESQAVAVTGLQGSEAVAALGDSFVDAENPAAAENTVPLYWQTGVAAASLADVECEEAETASYTGNPVYPAVSLTKDGKTLTADRDYMIASCENNVQPGTAAAHLLGLGRYSGSKRDLSFEIKSDVTVEPVADQTYTGAQIKPAVSVRNAEGKLLKAGTDYSAEYVDAVNVGTATVRLTGLGTHKDILFPSAIFTIQPADIGSASVTGLKEVYPLNQALSLKPVIKAGSQTLKENTDYSLNIYDIIHRPVDVKDIDTSLKGSYSIVFTGKGNYTGELEWMFDIGDFLTLYRMEGEDGTTKAVKTWTYQQFKALKSAGCEENPVSAMYFYGGVWAVSTSAEYVTIDDLMYDAGLGDEWGEGAKLSYGGDPAQNKKTQVFDYETLATMRYFYPESAGENVSMEKEVEAPAVLTITEFSDKSSDSVTCGEIEQKNIKNANINNLPRLIMGVARNDIKDPEIWQNENERTRGMRLWSNNEQIMLIVPKKADTDTPEAQDGKDGTQNDGQTLKPGSQTVKPISQTTVASISARTYSGKAIRPVPVVKNGTAVLKAGTDYTCTYSSNVNVGKATVIITGKGTYTGSRKITFSIKAKSVAPAVVLKKTSFVYTGKAIKPAIKSVKAGNVTLKKTDYSVSYKKNKAAGNKTAQVVVTLKGNYTGKKIVKFTITKAKQPMAVKVNNRALKYKKVKKKAQTLANPFTFTKKAQGAVTYKKLSGNKKITVNAKTGKITVKKGIGKKTWKIKVRISTKGNTNYAAGKLEKTVKIQVK